MAGEGARSSGHQVLWVRCALCRGARLGAERAVKMPLISVIWLTSIPCVQLLSDGR